MRNTDSVFRNFELLNSDILFSDTMLNHLICWMGMEGGGFQDGGEGNADVCSDER